MSSLSLAAAIAATLGAYIIYTLLKILYQEYTSPLRNVPGPKSDHWFLGNRQQLFKNIDGQEGLWTTQYGRTVRINTFLGVTRAVHHILSNSYLYQKPAPGRILVVEEDVHKKQNPAFGPASCGRSLRSSSSCLYLKRLIQLRDVWTARASTGSGVARVNVLPEFSTAALDIIGKAGFNYDFHSLGADSHSTRDELHEAFAKISASELNTGLFDILKARFPVFRRILPNTTVDNIIIDSQATMRRIGQQLLQDSRQNIAEGKSADSTALRDLLSLLVRANMAKDISDAQRLSEEDVLARHETTAATWGLFELATNPEVQTRLRNELLAVDNDNPSMDELNALPYLDCFLRETLRAHAPVPMTFRVATREDIIPLETPYTDRNGTVHETIRPGQTIVLPILSVNRDPALWGADAHRFRPERWERSPALSTSIPGLWSQMLTFLGGPRACIGFRFSLVELKALMFTLVRALEFELAVPAADIGRLAMTIVQQPVVRSDLAAGTQMPILIRPFTQS
ncbi:cytochrome P450 [Mycena olivaceomarginata]|nr:cytochrome P450 [Mycena olivaceomarginata]